MKKMICIGLLLVVFSVQAQKGKIFPALRGVALDGKSVSLPIKNGKYSIVAIAFHRSAEEDLKEWLNPLYSNFMKKEKSGNFDMAELYDVNFTFVPIISGFKTIAQEFKKGTDKEFWPYIIDSENINVEDFQKQLDIHDNKIPYFFVLNKEGKIVDVQSGKFIDAKLEKLEDAIE